MCDPLIMTGLAVAGTLTSAAAQYQQGQTAERVARYNADAANLQAEDALKRGSIEADRQRDKVKQIAGAQRAAMGASGATVDTGTLGDVLEQTATYGELDARQIEVNAQREAWGLRTKANADLFQGRAAAGAGRLAGFGTLLTGGTRAYGIYRDGLAGASPKPKSVDGR